MDDPWAETSHFVILACLRRGYDQSGIPRSELKKDGNRAVIFCSTTDPYQVFRHPDPEQRKKSEHSLFCYSTKSHNRSVEAFRALILALNGESKQAGMVGRDA